MKIKIPLFTFILLLMLSQISCNIFNPEPKTIRLTYQAQVLEQGTNKPIEGIGVVLYTAGGYGGLGGSGYTTVAKTKTDANGNFVLTYSHLDTFDNNQSLSHFAINREPYNPQYIGKIYFFQGSPRSITVEPIVYLTRTSNHF